MSHSAQAKKAIIMGATSGIGQEVARCLSEKGWLLGLAGRRTAVLEQMQKDLHGVIAIAQIDITDANSSKRLEDLILSMGGIDLYFHSSGIGFQNTDLNPDLETATLETNALGFVRCITTVFNYSAQHPEKQLHIAAISSIARTKGLGAAPAYSATKRLQSQYLESLAQLAHIRHLPIILTDIRPGFVDTPLIESSNYPLKLEAKEVAKKIVRAIEKKRSVVTLDWRYRLLVAGWRLIPRCIWVRLPIH
ncbi:MAG: SDR family NAD(P)-dependent oxidoreductase [Alloprevotella sp.]|nr:SDR family NAD(P)-dependent oxidoreductase [Alloprevotella sp.]